MSSPAVPSFDGGGATAGAITPERQPEIDEDGLVRHRGAWVALSPKLEAVLRLLLASPGKVVSRGALEALLWPGDDLGSKRLDALMARLRARILPLGLVVHTVRARGFQLEVEREQTANDVSPLRS